MELVIKLSAAEAEEAIAGGLIKDLIKHFADAEKEKKKEQNDFSEGPVLVEEPEEPEPPEEPAFVGTIDAGPAPAAPVSAEPIKTEKIGPVEIREVLNAMRKTHREEMRELFGRYGIKSLPDLPEDQYTDFYEAIKAVIGHDAVGCR